MVIPNPLARFASGVSLPASGGGPAFRPRFFPVIPNTAGRRTAGSDRSIRSDRMGCPRCGLLRGVLLTLHFLRARVGPLLLVPLRRRYIRRRKIRMILQILLPRLIAKHDPESSVRIHIDRFLDVQFVVRNRVLPRLRWI